MDPTVNDSATSESAQQFGRDLVELRRKAGRPSYSTLEKASNHELKRATVSDHLNGKRTGIPDWPFVFTFVNACRTVAEANGIEPEGLGSIAEWKQRWDTAERGLIDARFPGRGRRPAPLKQQPEAQHAAAGIPTPHEQHPLVLPNEGKTVWGPVPETINNFAGRERFLDDLHRAFTQDDRTGALTIQGVPGIGKTQLAAEYARRHRSEYDLVWWVNCATREAASTGMSELALRLGATGSSQVSGSNQFTAVFDELRLSPRYARWLLIFDDANDPEEIRKLIPPDRQNVLITSRNYEWSATDNLVELTALSRDESVGFLRERRRELSEVEAHRLADALGDLPLALEHAAESSFEATEYLEKLERGAINLFSGDPPSAYPETIADTWQKTIDRLRTDAPDAMALLGCLAFFSSDPIPRESMERGRFNQALSLHHILRDPVRFFRAIGALRRLGLLSVSPDTGMFHVHQLTRRMVRTELSVAEQERSRHDVHLLLAGADPANPEDPDSWVRYEELRGHMTASAITKCQDMDARFLVINFVRYLYTAGEPKKALSQARRALGHWMDGVDFEKIGPEDVVLAMHRANAEVLCYLGLLDDACEVCDRTRRKMRITPERWLEEITALGRITGIRLRKEGDFISALSADIKTMEEHVTVFGRDHPQTFIAMNNLCIDYSLIDEHAQALDIADEAYRRCRAFYDRADHPSVLYQRNALARCKRLSGSLDEALSIMNEINARYLLAASRNAVRSHHPWLLLHKIDLATVRLEMGLSDPELKYFAREMHHVHLYCWQSLGPDHPLTLAAAITRGSLLRRILDRLNEADTLISDSRQRYISTLGPSHPYSHACGRLLAGIRQQRSSPEHLRHQIEYGSDFTPLPL